MRFLLLPLFLLSLLGLAFQSCIPELPEDELIAVRRQDKPWLEPIYRRIADYQDKGWTDSLLPFLSDADPTWRLLAARAFGSIQDPAAIASLCSLLQDTVPEVRSMAAFALGQTADLRAASCLTAAFDGASRDWEVLQVNGAILEALGKCGSEKTLKYIASVTTYLPTDSALVLGQARAIYRFGLRSMMREEGSRRMVTLATDASFPLESRLLGAHYLARMKDLPLDTFRGELIPAFQGASDAGLRMALALALGKVQDTLARKTLLLAFSEERDHRVKINMLRALRSHTYEYARVPAYRSLKSVDPSLSREAAGFFLEKGIAREARTYWKLAEDSLIAWPARSLLYAAAHRHWQARDSTDKDRFRLNAAIKYRYASSSLVAEKAALLRALGEYGWNYRFLAGQMMASGPAAVRVAAVEALASLCVPENFDRQIRKNRRFVEKELALIFRQALQLGDAGISAVAAQALRQPGRGFREWIPDPLFLDSALLQLTLPREQETRQELEASLAFWKGKAAPIPAAPAYNHPIPWKMLDDVGNQVEVTFRMEKGDIVLVLYPDLAPGTVANFLELCRSGFFRNKNFHRVVPNFVSQGGCPRGDGFGSGDYTIRSEFTPVYFDRAGCVGMASAGKHTEGTQFFITHSATPHLDGKYTLFGYVKNGLELASQLAPGDKILQVSVRK